MPAPHRRRRVNPLSQAVLGVVLLAILALLLSRMKHDPATTPQEQTAAEKPSERAITLFCASGLRAPVEAIVAEYSQKYETQIQVQYGGSNTLLSQIELARVGDLFLVADEQYLNLAVQKKLVDETMPIGTMKAVVVVKPDNPLKIHTLADLEREDVRTAMAGPDQAAIGQVVKNVLSANGSWERLANAVTTRGVFQPTVTEVANSVVVGAVDAGIVWNTTILKESEVTTIDLPELEHATAEVAIGVLASTTKPTEALRFARFLTSKDRGLKTFEKFRYQVVEGDVWSDSPELTFYCGAVNRRAVESIISQFENREGVRINTVYNGCGILTGQMKVIQDWRHGEGFPDTYMACDRYYLDVVKDQFQEDVDVSQTEVVIAVQKGNPRKIANLQDLTKEGLRLAVGQPKQCTIGVITRSILKEEGILEAVMKNVVTETCSSALLIPAVVTGSVDAAMVYRSDTFSERDKIDLISIDAEAAKAIQPFSIAKSSSHKWLSRRFFRTMARSREKFESAGFDWKLRDSEVVPATSAQNTARKTE